MLFRSDKAVLLEEIMYLVKNGYREDRKMEILNGLEFALDNCPDFLWKHWIDSKLEVVIDDLIHIESRFDKMTAVVNWRNHVGSPVHYG